MRTILYTMLLCSIAHIAKAQCNATITPLGPTTFCAPGSVTLQASPGSVYKWYKDGNYFALLVTNTLTVSASGSYVVVVDSSGCIDTSAAVTVVANTVQPQAAIITAGDTFICPGTAVTLAATMGSAYQWYLDGLPLPGADSNTHSASVAGSYTVVVDSMGCLGTSGARIITQNYIPASPVFVGGPDTICEGSVQTFNASVVLGATGYLWYNIYTQDTTLLPTVTSVVAPGLGQPYTYVGVSATNACGTSSITVKQVINFAPPQIDGHYPFERDVADRMIRICPGTSYTLFPVTHGAPGIVYTDPYTFQWYLDNAAIPGATGRDHVITRGGNYAVKITTHFCGAVFTVPKKVYQDVPNSISIFPAGPLDFCTDNPVSLTPSFDTSGVSDPFSYFWLTPRKSGWDFAPSLVPDTSGYYTVSVSSVFNQSCEILWSSNAVYVTVPPLLKISQVDDTLFATPGYDSYRWHESGSPIPGATQYRHTLTYDGIYSVEGIFSNGCVETSGTIDPNFKPADPEIELAGSQVIVSPNPVVGVFRVRAKVPVADKKATIQITDATGQTLYEKTVDVVDGIVAEEIDMGKGIGSFCILKLQSPGSSQTTRFFKAD